MRGRAMSAVLVCFLHTVVEVRRQEPRLCLRQRDQPEPTGGRHAARPARGPGSRRRGFGGTMALSTGTGGCSAVDVPTARAGSVHGGLTACSPSSPPLAPSRLPGTGAALTRPGDGPRYAKPQLRAGGAVALTPLWFLADRVEFWAHCLHSGRAGPAPRLAAVLLLGTHSGRGAEQRGRGACPADLPPRLSPVPRVHPTQLRLHPAVRCTGPAC